MLDGRRDGESRVHKVAKVELSCYAMDKIIDWVIDVPYTHKSNLGYYFMEEFGIKTLTMDGDFYKDADSRDVTRNEED